MRRDPWTIVLAVLAAVLVGGGITYVATEDGEGGTTRTVRVGPPVAVPAAIAVDSTGDGTLDKAIELGPEAQEVAGNATRTPEQFDMAGDLRGDDSTPIAEDTGPLATRNFPGCATRILPTNWSNRTSSVRGVGLHYTAGANRPGLADMNGLTAYASSPSAGVSWHFLIDSEGNCYYSVPLDNKAWTIGNLNSQTVNIECIGTGREASYCGGTPAGAAKLKSVVRRLANIYNLPLRVGSVSGCTITRPGIVAHWQGGSCAGGHADIRPYAIERVVAQIARDPCGARCRASRRLRARHQRTHELVRKRRCATKREPRHGYCAKLRARNKRIHAAARARNVSLAGTYR